MIKLQTTPNQNPQNKIWNKNINRIIILKERYYKRKLKNELT